MATLSRGRYTYGNKTWAQIITITGASVGDTVWDTTYNKRRSWDGSNFVHSNQKSMVTSTGLIDGAVVVCSSTVNNQIGFQTGTADTEGIIGVVEEGKGNVSGVTVPMTYHGDVKALIVAGTGTASAQPGDYVRNSTANGGYGDTAAAGVGTFGIYLDSTQTTTGLRRILFKPVERA